MSLSRRLYSATALIIAPWLYLIGRTFSAPKVSQLAISTDPQYLRALDDTGTSAQIRPFRLAALLAAESTPNGAQAIKRILDSSEAQFLQDVFCALSLDEKQNGFFVEVGVGSGQKISNTFMLEKYYRWSGVLVEPNRSSHESIAAVRSALLERRAAACRSGQTVKFQELIDAGEHSRIAGTGGHVLSKMKTVEYEVDTISLNDLLAQVGAPKLIDYLSIDTEGSEIDILEGLDLNQFQFRIMTIEHNHNQSFLSRLDEILVPFGYRRVFSHISSVDAWYVHKDVQSLSFGWAPQGV